MPLTTIRYIIPGTEKYVEVSVEYDETTTFGELKPFAHHAINQALIEAGYPSLKELRAQKRALPKNNK